MGRGYGRSEANARGWCRWYREGVLTRLRWSFVGVAFALAITGCGDDDGSSDARSDGDAGSACAEPSECYPEVEEGELRSGGVAGQATTICLADVEGGYCTHTCETDEDCCAVDGECNNAFAQVCAPFQSTGMRMCFLTCEGQEEANFCQDNAHPDFGCRSTGGGADNRKVCVP